MIMILSQKICPSSARGKRGFSRVPTQIGHISWPGALLGTRESQPNWISVHSPGFAKRFLRLILARCPANRALILSAQAAWLLVSATPQRGRVIWRSVAWSSTPLMGSCDTHWNSLPGKMERTTEEGDKAGAMYLAPLHIPPSYLMALLNWVEAAALEPCSLKYPYFSRNAWGERGTCGILVPKGLRHLHPGQFPLLSWECL